jgi:hypothetical protein
MIFAYGQLGWFIIPFPEFLAYAIATLLVFVTTRGFSILGARAAFRLSLKLSLVYCFAATVFASWVRIHFESEQLNWIQILVGGILLAVLFKFHILLFGCAVGIALGACILGIFGLAKAISVELAGQKETQINQHSIGAAQTTVRSLLCFTSHAVIFFALINWLTQLYVNPDFAYGELNWQSWYAIRR